MTEKVLNKNRNGMAMLLILMGTLLGGMAQADRSRYDDYIGFILGTGTNSCCQIINTL